MTPFRSDGRWNGHFKGLHWTYWGAKCVCRCAKCNVLCKPVKSKEWSWTLYKSMVFDDERPHTKKDGDDYFCRRCFLTIQRHEQERRKRMEIDNLIRQINRAKPDGTD